MKKSGFYLEIPGGITIKADNLILDYNGTLARDGILLQGVAERIIQLARIFKIHVVTADTFGNAASQLKELPLKIVVIPRQEQAQQKLNFLEKIGCVDAVAIGNGRNDILMLKNAVLGIGIMQSEGCYSGIIASADLIYSDINDALDGLIHPDRIKAALRN